MFDFLKRAAVKSHQAAVGSLLTPIKMTLLVWLVHVISIQVSQGVRKCHFDKSHIGLPPCTAESHLLIFGHKHPRRVAEHHSVSRLLTVLRKQA